MEPIFVALRGLHIVTGSAVLVLFWVPIIAPKGGPVHIRIGWVYVVLIAVTVATALAMSGMVLADPLAVRPLRGQHTAEELARFARVERLFALFLAYLAGIILIAGWHGLRVLRRKKERHLLGTPFHVALNALIVLCAVAMLIVGIRERAVVLAILSPVGLLVGIQNLRYLLRPPANPLAWWFEHLRSMIPTGIAAYLAFTVFGARRVVPSLYQSSYYWLFWALPLVIGVAAIRLTIRHYRRKFREVIC